MFDPNYIEPPDLPQPDPYAENPSTTAIGGTIPSGSNPSGFTPMYIGDWHDPVGGGPDTTAPTGGSATTDFYGTPDQPTMTDQQMIDQLGYDPGNPRNDLTTGFGSGRPTDRIINGIFSFLGNAAAPGVGQLTGPAAQGIYDMISHGASRAAVQNAINAFKNPQGSGGTPTTGNTQGGGGFSFNLPSNLGGLGKPMGYFQPTGGYGQGDPGDYNPTGPMGGVGTAGIVDSSSPAGGGSFFGGRGNLGMSLPGSFNNIGAGGGGMLAPGMANLYLHGTQMQNWAQNQGYNNVGDWLRQTGFTIAGGNPSGAGVSGGLRPMTSSR